MVQDIVRGKGYLTLGSRLRRIGERLQAETQQLMEAHDVPVQAHQYPLLCALDDGGPLSIGDLTEALGVSQPGVTRNVGLLARRGMVTVRRGATDQRVTEVALSPAGRAVVDHGRTVVWPQVEACVAAILDGHSGPLLDQLDHLEDALDRASLAQRLAPPGGDRRHG
ncbi:MAG: MarR family transcriptional regulator [Hyphomicrobiales bacterium]|nr:MarR family transcriptional regulator [Hyphomicrobiales bacterium]MCP5371054.1 MarR family transcriptional regulator [Hyphomicrobiales bacterium]